MYAWTGWQQGQTTRTLFVGGGLGEKYSVCVYVCVWAGRRKFLC
jgi:hypothetical protein